LRALRNLVATRSPFYQRFHRGLEARSLQDLPILTKVTLMENFDDLVTDRRIRLAQAERYLSTPPGARLFLDGTSCCPHPAPPGAAEYPV